MSTASAARGPQSMDAVSSFGHLVDNLPTWREKISQIAAYSSEKHEFFKSEYTRLVNKARPKRVKSPSVCSIHTDHDDDDDDDTASKVTSPPNLNEISPLEAGNRYIYAQVNRKRKSATSFRSGASGPMKFRTKQMVVIYYDSNVQEQLDQLVKSIGGSRNNLRKGKTAYTLSRGLQLPTLGRRYEQTATSSGFDGFRSAMMQRSAAKISTSKTDTSTTTNQATSGDLAFVQVDKELEQCQNLCETAAHQFLRDGDCKLELDTVLKKLDIILDIAKPTLDEFTAEVEKAAAEETASTADSTELSSDASLDERLPIEPLSKLAPRIDADRTSYKRPVVSSPNSAPTNTAEIEVDDDSDTSSIEVDLDQFRRPHMRGIRAV